MSTCRKCNVLQRSLNLLGLPQPYWDVLNWSDFSEEDKFRKLRRMCKFSISNGFKYHKDRVGSSIIEKTTEVLLSSRKYM